MSQFQVPDGTGSQRAVKFTRGRGRSDTLRICTEANEDGVYDHVIRLTPGKVTAAELERRAFASVDALIAYLKQMGGTVESAAFLASGTLAQNQGPRIKADSAWVREVCSLVETAINLLIAEFVSDPYLHRREHSIHCELERLITTSLPLDRQRLAFDGFKTRPVQKEWPETYCRPGKTGLGNFDLSILTPPPAGSSCDHRAAFCDGQIEPGIVIEMGLNYGRWHLIKDEHKLRNSRVVHGYLVHLARPEGEQQFGVEEEIRRLMVNEQPGRPRVAYAQLFRDKIRFRKLSEPAITEQPLRQT
jgi:hypothetical protein